MPKNTADRKPDKKDWFKIISRGSHHILFNDLVTRGITEYNKKFLKIDFRFHGFVRVSGDTFFLQKEWDEYKRKIKEQYEKDDSYFLKQAANYKKLINDTELFAISLSRKSFSSMTTIQLLDYFDRFVEVYSRCWCYTFNPWAVEEILHEYIDPELNDLLKKKGRETEFDNILPLITRSEKESYALKEKKAFLEMLSHKYSDKDIERHLKEYSWLGFYVFLDKSYKKEDLIERISHVNGAKASLEQLESAALIEQKRSQSLIKELGIKGKLLKRICLFREYSFLRTYRIEKAAYLHSIMKPFFVELAKRYGIGYYDLAAMTIDEIKKGKVDMKTIKERQKEYAWYMYNSSPKVLIGKEKDKIKKIFEDKIEISLNIREIKGTIANKGFASGKVRLIKSQYDVEAVRQFKKGDILVTPMTTPDYIVAVEKAAAIITDEGGILCHAAIIAREMNIPCIIGTKIASKVLKTGDDVEVDADTGIIRKIS